MNTHYKLHYLQQHDEYCPVDFGHLWEIHCTYQMLEKLQHYFVLKIDDYYSITLVKSVNVDAAHAENPSDWKVIILNSGQMRIFSLLITG
jgi:hypothetical protein